MLPAPSLPLAATHLTAEEIEIEIAANTVTNTIAASLGATIVVSVATTIGATVVASSTTAVAASVAAGAASASAGGIGGGVAGAASGGGGVGGGIMPDLITILMSTQRLSVLASMPVGMSKLHVRVGESLAWTKGSLGLFPGIVSEETLRQLWDWLGARPNKGDRRRSEELGSGDELNNAAEATEEAWVDALESLIDTLITLAFALAAVTRYTAATFHFSHPKPNLKVHTALNPTPLYLYRCCCCSFWRTCCGSTSSTAGLGSALEIELRQGCEVNRHILYRQVLRAAQAGGCAAEADQKGTTRFRS